MEKTLKLHGVLFAVLILSIGMLTLSAAKASCSTPDTVSDCAASCSRLRVCKRCCARGNFGRPDFDDCIHRCNAVLGKVIEEPVDEDDTAP